MSKHTKRARQLLEKLAREHRLAARLNPEVAALKEAAHWYWHGNTPRCAAIFFPLMDRIIVEPLKGTEEYSDGERKQEIAVEEQQEESESAEGTVTYDDLFRTESNDDAGETERDADGYLIR